MWRPLHREPEITPQVAVAVPAVPGGAGPPKPPTKSEAAAAAGTAVHEVLNPREATAATGCSKDHKNPFSRHQTTD